MALTCGFYNSVDGDRKYDATQFASLFDGVITDGVVAAVGDFFATTPGGGMTVDVGTGRAWFNRTWTYSDAKIPLTLDASDLLYDRIDAVVLEIDTSIAIRDNSIKVVKGTPAQSPQKPMLTNAGDVHQYALAYVRVKASAIEIGAGDITINVGQADCPFVTSIVETPELDALFARWDAQFTAWFENIQSQLEGDIAANLQRQIDQKLNSDIYTEEMGDISNAAEKIHLSNSTPITVENLLSLFSEIPSLHIWRKNYGSFLENVSYLISKQSNTYREGSNQVDGSYSLGSVQNSNVKFGRYAAPYNQSEYTRYKVASSITANVDGTIDMVSPQSLLVGYNSTDSLNQNVRGKYIMLDDVQNLSFFKKGSVYFIPSTATFTREGTSVMDYTIYVNQYQTVTGKAGIAANENYKYLGVLGLGLDNIELYSYIGTGTYGSSSNACEIRSKFEIKAVMYLGKRSVDRTDTSNINGAKSISGPIVQVPSAWPRNYSFTRNFGFYENGTTWGVHLPGGGSWQKIDSFEWYNDSSASAQLNTNGYEYWFLIFK